MKDKNSFYVGWQNEMPKSQRKFLKKVLIPLFVLIPILSLVAVWAQRPFNAHIFELGTISEHTGIYHSEPVPILEVKSKTLPVGVSNYVLLVGYGKHGAEGIMSKIESETKDLNNKKVRLQGSLIYGDGKAVLELTKKEKSLITVYDESAELPAQQTPAIKFEEIGEILDPKCYFGVMKPGEGKIHKSCAIRCISGGIPPVFRVRKENTTDYYILLGLNGEKVNEHILNKIGEDVRVSGTSLELNGWQVIHIDPTTIQ